MLLSALAGWTALLPAAASVAIAAGGGALGAVGATRGRDAAGLVLHFSAGALLTVTLLQILPEAAEASGWMLAILTALCAWLACAAVGRRLGGVCPGCASHSQAASIRVGFGLMAAVAVHCLLDGLPLAEGRHGDLFTWALLAHKLPEGMACGAALRNAGLSTPRAVGLTLLVQAFTLLGATVGVLAGISATPLLGVGLALTGGAYLYLTTATLAGIAGSLRARSHGLAAGFGAIAIAAATLALGVAH